MRAYVVLSMMGIVQVVCQVDARDAPATTTEDERELSGRRRRHKRRSLPSWIDDLEDYRQKQTDKYSFGLGDITEDDNGSKYYASDETNSHSSDELLAPFIDFTGEKDSSYKWGKGKSNRSSEKGGKGKSTNYNGKGKSGKRSDKGKGKGGEGSGKQSKQGGKGKGKGYYFEHVEKPIQVPLRPIRPPVHPVRPPQKLPSPIRSVFPPPTRTPQPALVPPPVVPDLIPVVTMSPTTIPEASPTMAPVAAATLAPVSVVPTVSPTTTRTVPPTVAMITSAPVVEVEAVPIVPYYIAFVAPLAEREPTDDEYLLITQLTTLYFEEIFATVYADDPSVNFLRVDTMIASVLFEAGIPEPEYNLYMAFNTSIIFSAISRELPPSEDLLAIMDASIGTSYIVDYVWQAPETPFISAQEAVLRPVNTSAVLPGTQTRSGDFEGLQTFINRYVLPGTQISESLFRKKDNVV